MHNQGSLPATRRTVVTILVFLGYALALWRVAHVTGHHFFHGWVTRLITIGIVALGLLPWGRWLAPRVRRLLAIVGRFAMLIAYFTLLVPFALIVAVSGGRRRWKGKAGGSTWSHRPRAAATLATAEMES